VGLTLHMHLFRTADHAGVVESFERYCHGRGRRAIETQDPHCYRFHIAENGWTVVELPIGWKREFWREMQHHITAELDCPALFVFVYDGNYWGYEFVKEGNRLDQFAQVDDHRDGIDWFTGSPRIGNPDLLAQEFSWLDPDVLSRYLIRDPLWTAEDHIWEDEYDELRFRLKEKRRELDTPVREGDEFTRFDECAVLDFLRYLGVSVELEDHRVTWNARVHLDLDEIPLRQSERKKRK